MSSSSSSSLDSSSSSSIDSSSSSSSSSSYGRVHIYAGQTYTLTESTEFEYFGGKGTTATIILLGQPFTYTIANIGGFLIWDYQGPSEIRFTTVGSSVSSIGKEKIFSVIFDGYGSLLFSIFDTGTTVPETPLVAMASREYGEGRILIHTDRVGGVQTGHGENPSSFWREVLEWTSGKTSSENINIGLLINTKTHSANRLNSFNPSSVIKIDLPYIASQDLSDIDLIYVVGLPDLVSDVVTQKIADYVNDGGGLILEYPNRGDEAINILSGIEDVYCYSDERLLQTWAYWTIEGSQSDVFDPDAIIAFMSTLRQVDFSSYWTILMSDVVAEVTTTTTTLAEEQAPDLAKASGSEFGVSYISSMQKGIVQLEQELGTSSSFSLSSESSSSSSSIDSSSTSSEMTYIDICSNIIAQWNMNDNTSTPMVQVEDNNYLHTATYTNTFGNQNTSTKSVVGVTNRAIEFDADLEDRAETPNNTSLNFSDGVTDRPFCISYWIYPTVMNGGYMIVKTNCYEIYQYGTNKIAIVLRYGGTRYFLAATTQALTANQWYHIAINYDGRGYGGGNIPYDGVQIYVDAADQGVLTKVAGGGGPVATPAMANDSTFFYFSSPSAVTPHYDGYMDNVMIFNRELTAREVEFLWNRGNGTEECEGIHWNTSSSSESSSSSSLSSSSSSSSSSSLSSSSSSIDSSSSSSSESSSSSSESSSSSSESSSSSSESSSSSSESSSSSSESSSSSSSSN